MLCAVISPIRSFSSILQPQLRNSYGNHKQGIAWLYSGAQKPQAIGVFQTFKKRLGEGFCRDIAVSFETSGGRRQIHILSMKGGELVHEAHDTEVDLTVHEYAMLFGQSFQEETGFGVWPTLEQEWGCLHPKDWNIRRYDALMRQMPMTKAFAMDSSFRNEVSGWPRGKVELVGGSKTSPEVPNNPYTAFFEHAVVERLYAFLTSHKEEHLVVDAQANIYRQSLSGMRVEYDILLTLSTGELIAFDAKTGQSKESYRKQKQGVSEIGGYSAKLYYISPWFPHYLSVANCDDSGNPWDPELSSVNGGPVWDNDVHRPFQRVYASWYAADESFGDAWDMSEAGMEQMGHRPPDYPEHPQFRNSLLIPFDAFNDETKEGLFEQRMRHLLCR